MPAPPHQRPLDIYTGIRTGHLAQEEAGVHGERLAAVLGSERPHAQALLEPAGPGRPAAGHPLRTRAWGPGWALGGPDVLREIGHRVDLHDRSPLTAGRSAR